jgi:hypothetical protein
LTVCDDDKEKKEKRKRKDSRAHGAVTSIGGSPGRARAVRILRGVYVPSFFSTRPTQEWEQVRA